jgi:hypothetical protein
MPRTSENEGARCPLCGEQLSKDPSGKGYVKHLDPPRDDSIFDDGEKINRMLSSGELSSDYLDYFKVTGHCPYQQGQKD